jgi:hypothetical protein
LLTILTRQVHCFYGTNNLLLQLRLLRLQHHLLVQHTNSSTQRANSPCSNS